MALSQAPASCENHPVGQALADAYRAPMNVAEAGPLGLIPTAEGLLPVFIQEDGFAEGYIEGTGALLHYTGFSVNSEDMTEELWVRVVKSEIDGSWTASLLRVSDEKGSLTTGLISGTEENVAAFHNAGALDGLSAFVALGMDSIEEAMARIARDGMGVLAVCD